MELLTTAQVEQDYGIPVGTLRYWRHAGTGPASFRLGGRRVVYRRSEIERWIEAQEEATRRGGDFRTIQRDQGAQVAAPIR